MQFRYLAILQILFCAVFTSTFAAGEGDYTAVSQVLDSCYRSFTHSQQVGRSLVLQTKADPEIKNQVTSLSGATEQDGMNLNRESDQVGLASLLKRIRTFNYTYDRQNDLLTKLKASKNPKVIQAMQTSLDSFEKEKDLPKVTTLTEKKEWANVVNLLNAEMNRICKKHHDKYKSISMQLLKDYADRSFGTTNSFTTPLDDEKEMGAQEISPLEAGIMGTPLSYMLEVKTNLQDHIGKFDPEDCVEDGKQFKMISTTKTIDASLLQVEEKFREALETIPGGKLYNPISQQRSDRDPKNALKKKLQIQPESIRLALVKTADANQARYLCTAIRQTQQEYTTKKIMFPVAVIGSTVITIFSGPAAPYVGIAFSSFFVGSNIRDLVHSDQTENAIERSLLSGQISPVYGQKIIASLRHDRPWSYANLALSGLGLVGSGIRLAQLSKIHPGLEIPPQELSDIQVSGDKSDPFGLGTKLSPIQPTGGKSGGRGGIAVAAKTTPKVSVTGFDPNQLKNFSSNKGGSLGSLKNFQNSSVKTATNSYSLSNVSKASTHLPVTGVQNISLPLVKPSIDPFKTNPQKKRDEKNHSSKINSNQNTRNGDQNDAEETRRKRLEIEKEIRERFERAKKLAESNIGVFTLDLIPDLCYLAQHWIDDEVKASARRILKQNSPETNCYELNSETSNRKEIEDYLRIKDFELAAEQNNWERFSELVHLLDTSYKALMYAKSIAHLAGKEDIVSQIETIIEGYRKPSIEHLLREAAEGGHWDHFRLLLKHPDFKISDNWIALALALEYSQNEISENIEKLADQNGIKFAASFAFDYQFYKAFEKLLQSKKLTDDDLIKLAKSTAQKRNFKLLHFIANILGFPVSPPEMNRALKEASEEEDLSKINKLLKFLEVLQYGYRQLVINDYVEAGILAEELQANLQEFEKTLEVDEDELKDHVKLIRDLYILRDLMKIQLSMDTVIPQALLTLIFNGELSKAVEIARAQPQVVKNLPIFIELLKRLNGKEHAELLLKLAEYYGADKLRGNIVQASLDAFDGDFSDIQVLAAYLDELIKKLKESSIGNHLAVQEKRITDLLNSLESEHNKLAKTLREKVMTLAIHRKSIDSLIELGKLPESYGLYPDLEKIYLSLIPTLDIENIRPHRNAFFQIVKNLVRIIESRGWTLDDLVRMVNFSNQCSDAVSFDLYRLFLAGMEDNDAAFMDNNNPMNEDHFNDYIDLTFKEIFSSVDVLKSIKQSLLQDTDRALKPFIERALKDIDTYYKSKTNEQINNLIRRSAGTDTAPRITELMKIKDLDQSKPESN